MATSGSNQTPMNSFALYRRLLAYIKPLWRAFALAILGFAIYAAASTWFFDLVRQLIDSIGAGATMAASDRSRIPLSLMLLVTLRGLGGFLGSYFMAWLAFRIIHQMRAEILQRFLQLPLGYFDRNPAGHLISAITFNVSQISAAVSDALAVMLREGAMIIGIVGYLLYLNWKLTLIFISVTPLISLVVMFAAKRFRKHSSRIQGSMGDVTQILSETLKGLKVIRTFGAEQQQYARFVEASQRNTHQNLKLSMTAAVSSPISQTLVAAAISLLIWLAMSPEAMANITPGEFAGFITAAGSLLKPVRQTSKVNADIQKGLSAAASIFELLDSPAEADTGTIEVARVSGRIEFRDLNFRYGNEKDAVIQHLNLVCAPGSTVAIVGKSGSGKTTLVNLLPRFYELQAGQILLDGVPHTDYTLRNLRHQIALVSQQVVLFNGSIRANVAHGELADRDDLSIITALENANAMEFVRELPQGLDTMVGDDGLLLSGGQRQRLAIARALLKDAPILILDEATSALDTASERYIQSALERLMAGRTTLVIAHRLSTIESADLIVVMEKGQIVEQGSHQALIAAGGAYARLHSMQFAEISES